MRPFRYAAPTSLDEALDKMAEGGVALAGGTDLLVKLKEGKLAPELVVDVGRIPELRRLPEPHHTQAGEELAVGAAVPLAILAGNPEVVRRWPLLRRAVLALGSPQVRSRATLGGNLSTASPAADTVPALQTLEAKLMLRSKAGARLVSATDFAVGPGQTVLRPGELVSQIRLPQPPVGAGVAFLKYGRRRAVDLSIVNVAVLLVLKQDVQGDLRCQELRLAVGAVAPTVRRLREIEEGAKGEVLSSTRLAAWAEQASRLVHPISDVRASAAYRVHLTRVLVRRALTQAVEAALA